jgi:general secretion pathway protein G
MTTCDRQGGFTLLELIVVLGVLGILLGTAVPLAGAVVEADRRQEVQRELTEIGAALASHWYDRASFPASLTAAGFLGTYLQPGVRNTTTMDAFASNQGYVYSVDAVSQIATVYSIGENGRDDGVANEEHVVHVHAAVPGTARTWQRLRIVVEVLANHIESGGSVSGDWPTVRARIGLGPTFDTDGFGTTLQWVDATHTLTSAGPDRTFGTADDISI